MGKRNLEDYAGKQPRTLSNNPICTGTKWNIKVAKGILCRVTRLEDEDAMMIFGTIMSPIIPPDEPMLEKLIRLAHRGELENKGVMHRTNGSTIAHLK